MNKTQKLTLAVTLLLSTVKASDDNSSMTFGEGVTAPGAFATNVGADILTLGRGHQTRNYIDRNRDQGADASSDNTTAGEYLMTPVSGTLNIFSGQTRQQGRRNFHSNNGQQNNQGSSSNKSRKNGATRSPRSKRSHSTQSTSNDDSSEGGQRRRRSSYHHCHNPFRERGEKHEHHNHGHWYHHHEQYDEATE